MNTKQVLYDVLKGQLDTKKQVSGDYYETVTKPALQKLTNNIKSFISTICPIDDSIKIDFNDNYSIRFIVNEDRYSNNIDLNLGKNDENIFEVSVEWHNGEYNLNSKNNKLKYINILHSLSNNLESISDKFINEWKVEKRKIKENLDNAQKEYNDLQYALDTLANEIYVDNIEAMKEIGFEFKQFKPHYNLEWDYKDTCTYRVVTNTKSIKLQVGRSQWDSYYVEGFKVLDKKGNKYNIEVNRQGNIHNYDVLEKKFEAFINEVAYWEYKQSVKQKNDVEKKFAERAK